MAEVLLVQSKVKEYLKAKGVNVSGDFAEQASKKIAAHLDIAVDRCKANGRKTIRGYDF